MNSRQKQTWVKNLIEDAAYDGHEITFNLILTVKTVNCTQLAVKFCENKIRVGKTSETSRLKNMYLKRDIFFESSV